MEFTFGEGNFWLEIWSEIFGFSIIINTELRPNLLEMAVVPHMAEACFRFAG